MVQRLVSEVKGDHAWISRDKINSALRARAAAETRPSAASSFARPPSMIDIQQQSSTSTLTEPSCKHGGRPKGSTDKNKRIAAEKENNLANEISVMWDQQLTEARENSIKNMPNGSLCNLINGRKEYNNMNHVNIHPDAIRSCAKQKNLVISHAVRSLFTNAES